MMKMSKSKGKHSFLFDYEFLDYFEFLEDSEIVQIIKDLVSYDRDDIIPQYDDRTLKTIFNKIKPILDERKVEYNAICERNKVNGSKGGRPKKDSKTQDNPKEPNGLNKNPKNLDSDYDYDYYVCNIKEENKKEENVCHFGNKLKTEACKDCLKRNICKNKTDPHFILEKGCDFETWIAKRQVLSKNIIETHHDPPEDKELENYKWFEGE